MRHQVSRTFPFPRKSAGRALLEPCEMQQELAARVTGTNFLSTSSASTWALLEALPVVTGTGGIEAEDLCQVAYAALTRAARAFDPARDKDFTSYAVPTIRGELKKHFRDLGWVVRPPRRVQEIEAAVIRAEGELVQQAGRSPRPSEIAEHLGVDVGS